LQTTGGNKKPADLSAKAIAAGATIGILEDIFAGPRETPGEVIDGKKIARGSTRIRT